MSRNSSTFSSGDWKHLAGLSFFVRAAGGTETKRTAIGIQAEFPTPL
jgi:hypothetical protein